MHEYMKEKDMHHMPSPSQFNKMDGQLLAATTLLVAANKIVSLTRTATTFTDQVR